MRKLFYPVLLSAIIFFSTASVQAEMLKIAIFDTQRILAESKVVKKYRQKLMETTDAKRKLFADKQEAMRQTAEKLRTEGGKMTFYERKNLEEKLALEDKELRRLREDLDYEIQKMDKDLTQQALLDIEKIIREIVRKEDFTVIFERSSAGIVHFKESVDLTPRIISLYDKQ
ncbi:MAG: OmpH family outer membrane protein [Nitrospirae bacterium]|nr:MAG: OmpH family outer membrane protein [Nitrospirota bacterium]